MKGELEHTDMLDVLRATKAAVVLSGYDSEAYSAALDGWDVRRIGALSQEGVERTEVLWSNRPLEDTLFGDWEDAS